MKFFQLTMLALSLLVFTTSLAGQSKSQSQVLGTYNSTTQQFTMTADSKQLIAAFEESLGNDGATVSDLQLIGRIDGSKSKFLIGGYVKNDPQGVNFISWEVINTGGVIILDRSTDLIEHSCKGNPCSSCKQVMNMYLVIGCECTKCDKCTEPGRCDHSVTVKL